MEVMRLVSTYHEKSTFMDEGKEVGIQHGNITGERAFSLSVGDFGTYRTPHMVTRTF